ncbi:hypothetical protein PCASD_01349 [Puccinia coronata f. sp. avenae]|uniref:Wax synthase domain-containing protein n=1 Tax=Puccinia coronata f. sp. avenae TaxID=200324 RepID=A0A2N5VIW9_9BASI|nr:hypothetical protein PCASD_01349 [Puccinia coronata f. sp. avenae]
MGTWGDEPFSDNQFKRMVVGYTFLIPLIIQAFLMNPIYEKSKQVKLIRMGLIPLTIYLTVTRTYIRLFYPLNEFFHWNFAFISFSTFHAVCLSLQFGLYRGSVFASKSDLIKAGNYRGDPDDKKDQQERLVPQNPTPSFLEKVKFTIWLLFSPRGLETSWAPALDVVPRGAKMSVGQFFIHTLCKTVVCHITGTVLWIIAANNAQHPYGAYGVIADYIPPLQFLKKFTQFDYLTSFYFAAVSWASIETLGCLLNLLEIAVYQFGPYVLPKDLAPGKFDSTLYPPLFNDLLERESMITFWSKGWHAIFRRNIVFCGWNPAESMFASFGKDTAKTAGMMGGMIFSGIFHEYRTC